MVNTLLAAAHAIIFITWFNGEHVACSYSCDNIYDMV